ncbi:MAG: type II toxin-antitoxin system Phd/YefM family antitoxin [Treponema sp.]|nr:type II toxin-antitoxin system Phd/YefM family antitoxin [Treponema sp.]
MPVICPVTDLKTRLSEITRVVHETDEPVFLTNKGYGDMVVMSMNNWEEMNFENEIYQKLIEAQAEAQSNPMRLSHDEVFKPLRQKIKNYIKTAEND